MCHLGIILIHSPNVIPLLLVRPDFARRITNSTEPSAVDTVLEFDTQE